VTVANEMLSLIGSIQSDPWSHDSLTLPSSGMRTIPDSHLDDAIQDEDASDSDEDIAETLGELTHERRADPAKTDVSEPIHVHKERKRKEKDNDKEGRSGKRAKRDK
jgi:DNA-directed RNA polymerase I subunit RPA43